MKTATLTAVGEASTSIDRVIGFDLLRGLCALAVAAYHVMSWNAWGHLHTWGTYGVYMFFVLSGASMYVAYARRFADGLPITSFLRLRLIRLGPLYLAALALVLLAQLRTGFDLGKAEVAFLNLFFQFGLGNPGATSLVVGGWSLGIEFVFYLLFPVMLALVNSRWWWLPVLMALVSQHVFIASVFSNGKGIAENWNAYTQFLSFCFYFLAGCVIGRALLTGLLRPHWAGAPLLLGLLTVLGSVSGSTWEATIVGVSGVGLSILATMAVAVSAILRTTALLTWFAEHLGRASYGIYLLHPFVAYGTRTITEGPVAIAIVLTVSVAFALLVERYYERPIQQWLKSR